MSYNVINDVRQSQGLKKDFKNESNVKKPILTPIKIVSNIIFFLIFSLASVFVSWYTYILVESINDPIRSTKKDYQWPSISDFSHLLWELPMTISVKIFIEKIAGYFTHLLISAKYRNPDGSPNDETRSLELKIRTNIFKTIYNIFITLLGYHVLGQLNYYPKELIGNGDIVKMFEAEYPGFYFHYKPRYFDFLYMMNLVYYLIDLIWVILINESTSDYNLMVFHHVSSILLISFSFWTNTSNIGSIIFYLHNIGNIFVYLLRVFLYSDLSKYIKAAITLVLISVWIYTRLYVFGKIIIVFYLYLKLWSIVIYILFTLCLVLYVMHVYWVYEIMVKLKLLLCNNTAEDVSKIKKR